MVLLRLMFVDRGGSAAGRKARVEGMRESEKKMERRTRMRIMVLVERGWWGELSLAKLDCGTSKRKAKNELVCLQ